MKRLFLSFVALALLAGSIAACCQKGPLYLPDDEKAKKEHSKDRYGF
ncbi:TPA: lipoprotein [Pseudomonas aeruginosa]